MLIDSEPDASLELADVVDDDDDDDDVAAAGAAAVLLLELLELPHPATAITEAASAASAPARNTVVQVAMMLLPDRGFTGPMDRRVTHEDPGRSRILPAWG